MRLIIEHVIKLKFRYEDNVKASQYWSKCSLSYRPFVDQSSSNLEYVGDTP